MRRIIFIAVLAAATSSLALDQTTDNKATQNTTRGQQISNLEREILRMEREFAVATMRNDMAALDRIMADDYTFTDSSGTVRTKTQMLADLAQVLAQANVMNVYKIESINPDELKVRVYGDSAVVTGRTRLKAYTADQSISDQYRFRRVWVKQQGRWQLVANHSTRIAQQ
jgi:ketosteroid isomerase-like protein